MTKAIHNLYFGAPALIFICLSCDVHAAIWQHTGYIEVGANAQDLDASGKNWTAGGYQTLGTGKGVGVEARLGLSFVADDDAELAWRFVLNGLARTGTQDSSSKVGFTEAFAEMGALDRQGWRIRAGQAFAGTSRENVEALWQTPYSINLSALNSWIGEEFRPIGIGLAKRFQGASAHTDIEATAYIGNDTGPAILAWRGFALHSRLSVFGETLPILPLQSIVSGGFAAQRREGSQPFGPDLDGRVGYAIRARHSIDDGPNFSAFYTDNRGDRDLHDGDEYAWANRFAVAGFDWPINPDWTLLGEAMNGITNMGFPPGPNVEARYNTQYLMAARTAGQCTYSLRIERFRVKEGDFSAELNDQNGRAATFAIQRQQDSWRFGLELTHADIERPGNADEGAPIEQGGLQLSAVARYYFD
jgi:hypothetical protein